MKHRRTILKALLLLAAGAALNVAVAWGLAVFNDAVIEFAESFEHANPVAYWPPGVPSSWPPTQQYWTKWREFGITLATADQVVADPSTDDTLEYWAAACMETGWPCRSMRSLRYVHERGDGQVLERSPDWMAGLPPSRHDPQPGFLPPLPIWPGFAVNTVFYAAVLWMLFCGPSALRRTIRRRRGQCPACGYPVGESPICTECGAAIAPVRASS